MSLQRSSLSVLLVEDNPGDAKLVEHHLDAATAEQFIDDVSLTHYESLTAGIDAVETEHFDLVLLDLGLPESTGLETVDRAVGAGLTDEVPIIVLTGLSDHDTAIEAIKRGAQDFLPKEELDSDRLVRALRYAIERHDQEQRLRRQAEQISFFNRILRHDMLNGMNVIRARGDQLSRNLDGEQRNHAETITKWSDNIIDLAEKVRSVLETLSDDSDRSMQWVEFSPHVESAAEQARSLGASVAVDVPEDLRVKADPLLEDVLTNLTTNAVEHGTDDPATLTVKVTAVHDGSTVDVTVADDGRGIDHDDPEQFFQQGQKGSGSGGTGFGLYFVASMIEAYGGSVAIEESDHGGTAVELTLPAARDEW